jgi:transposase
VEQQDMTAWHRIRERKVHARTALVNQLRALLGEQGIIIPQGITHVRKLLPKIIEDLENKLSMSARDYLSELYSELVEYDEAIAKYESRIVAFAKGNESCRCIQKIPGVGPLTATAIVAHVGQATQFKNGRAFAACLGLTPREHSSGGKQKLLGITKRGNSYIRRLLIQGARVVLRYGLLRPEEEASPRIHWLRALCGRRGKHIATVALANKMARIIWALLSSGESYQPSAA